ncbi:MULTISPECIES: hypothetical protein [unclassified Pseudodesulfovibrio]|uniref:hypothetical protein n=1 Tax=unclassified Pseudodesulfovibrio TaxID=2661612 RepID=UPI000FEB9BDF|nr:MULTISPECIES: hypothetical protein [unclassified Pseudodesulfovibrio]MCJ2164815.1 hypothetical protein [Pseudodesulfovibrio sp. S3-i]RWU03814.1 hypothetical protein DWB63_10180 [Pseudodesulfovibrio sp. S3]
MPDAPNCTSLQKTLFRRYLLMLAPAALIFGGWAACRQAGLTPNMPSGTAAVIGPIVFIAAIILAVALPLLCRVGFVRKVEGQKNVESAPFLDFQLTLMSIALTAPFAAAAGYIAGVANFHFAGAFLASLYAAYYYYPSEKRIHQEMRLFRVTSNTKTA